MSYRIPLFDLNFDETEEQAALECLRSKWISTGPRTAEFERLFSEMMDGAHAVALANCTVYRPKVRDHCGVIRCHD